MIKATHSILSIEYPMSRNGEWLRFSTTLSRFLVSQFWSRCATNYNSLQKGRLRSLEIFE